MPNLSDSQIDHIADRIITSYCYDEICNHISKIVQKDAQSSHPHKEFFDVLYKALESHEKRFATGIKEIWRGHERIIVANIKKLKKAYMGKQHEETINSLLYPQSEAERDLAKFAKTQYDLIMLSEAQRVIAEYGLEIAFDMLNPLVVEWLKSYIPTFSKNLEAVSIDKLRRELIAGLEAGEGIPKLTKRVNNTYNNWYKFRSETIARSEIIRASNRANIEAYRQSGVVKKKVWMCSPGCCDLCADLCDAVIELEETFVIDKEQRKISEHYGVIDYPPRHPRCRCAIAPVIE